MGQPTDPNRNAANSMKKDMKTEILLISHVTGKISLLILLHAHSELLQLEGIFPR
jgi:hypothetical protein